MQILESLTTAFRSQRDIIAQTPVEKQGVNRWALYKQLCIAKAEFGLNDRCLAVLSSLLSFLPSDQIDVKFGLVVFPSNRQLSLRAHGMPESTLRRHLASLVDAGIIARKDSPTRKRYAHKDREGAVELAFGFSFEPLLQLAQNIAQAAESIQAEAKALKRLRDEVSVTRRDITAAFAGLEPGALNQALSALFDQYRGVVDAIPRRASSDELRAINARLAEIRSEMGKALKCIENEPELSATDAQYERHQYESLPESHLNKKENSKFDCLIVESSSEQTQSASEPVTTTAFMIPLDTVLRACPDILSYAANGIRNWRDMDITAKLVSGFLGINGALLAKASMVLGKETANAVIAWILQQSGSIQSPGGYLQALVHKARGNGFSISSLLLLNLKA